MMKTNSLHFKISLWYILTLAIILLSFSGLLVFSQYYSQKNSLDSLLNIKAGEIRRNIELQTSLGAFNREKLFFVMEKLFHKDFYVKEINKMWKQRVMELGLYNDYVQILDAKGNVIGRSSNMSEKENLTFTKQNLSQIMKKKTIYLTDKEKGLRMIAVLVEKEEKPQFIIQLGTSLKPVFQNFKKLLIFIAVFIPVVLLVTSFIGNFIVSKALNPVDSITRTARKITLENLDEKVEFSAEDEEIQNLVGTFNDMLERLKRSLAHVMEFNSHVSHELRTPLSIIKGESELVLRKERSLAEYRRSIQGNLEEVNRMYRIIDDLLCLSRLDYHRNIYTLEAADFKRFISEVIDQTSILAKEKNIVLEKNISEEDMIVNIDSTHLRRLFFNIIGNALKFTPRGGVITIGVFLELSSVIVRIADSGPGILSEDLDRIFEPFFRSSASKADNGTEDYRGSGLGLAIARSIAVIHRGEIQVISVPGEGAAFTVMLPLQTSPSQLSD